MHWNQVSTFLADICGVTGNSQANSLISSMSFAEMYLTISRVAQAFDFELYETTAADLDMTYARIVPYPKEIPGKKEGLGEMRVKVLNRNYPKFKN